MMSDNIKDVLKAIEEHNLVRESVKSVESSMNDLNALFLLQRERADWALSSAEAQNKSLKKLKTTLDRLYDGLSRHFGFEEAAFPALIGDILMQSLSIDHREIKDSIEKTRAMVEKTDLQALGEKELLDQKTRIQTAINNLCQIIQEHATEEDVLLKMLRKSLENK